MITKQIAQSKSNESLDFTINDLLEAIKARESFGPNYTFQNKSALERYHRDLLACVTEKCERNARILAADSKSAESGFALFV